MPTFVRYDRAVNSKHLVKAIAEFVEEGILNAHILWSSDTHRESFIIVIEDLLMALELAGKISQGDVVCDARNNKMSQMDKGIFQFDISFKQNNCVNTTHIDYTITVEEEFELPDFDGIFP